MTETTTTFKMPSVSNLIHFKMVSNECLKWWNIINKKKEKKKEGEKEGERNRRCDRYREIKKLRQRNDLRFQEKKKNNFFETYQISPFSLSPTTWNHPCDSQTMINLNCGSNSDRHLTSKEHSQKKRDSSREIISNLISPSFSLSCQYLFRLMERKNSSVSFLISHLLLKKKEN